MKEESKSQDLSSFQNMNLDRCNNFTIEITPAILVHATLVKAPIFSAHLHKYYGILMVKAQYSLHSAVGDMIHP